MRYMQFKLFISGRRSRAFALLAVLSAFASIAFLFITWTNRFPSRRILNGPPEYVDFDPTLPGRILVAEGGGLSVWDLSEVNKADRLATLAESDVGFEGIPTSRPTFWPVEYNQALCKYSPNGQFIACGSNSGMVSLWKNTTNYPKAGTFNGHSSRVKLIAFSPDSTMLASGDKGGLILLTNTGTLQSIVLGGHTDGICSLVFSPDGIHLASASKDQTVRLWSTDGKLRAGPFKFENPNVYNGYPSQLAFSPDGKLLASAMSDYTLSIWSTDGSLIAEALADSAETVHTNTNNFVVFSGDASRLLTCGFKTGLTIWRLDQLDNPIPVTGHSMQPSRATWLKSSNRFVTIDSRGDAILWDENGTLCNGPLRIAPFECQSITLAVSADERMIATIDSNKLLQFWTNDIQPTGLPMAAFDWKPPLSSDTRDILNEIFGVIFSFVP
jgi:WD40 repeat protein